MKRTKHWTHRSALVLETDGVVKEGRSYAMILGMSSWLHSCEAAGGCTVETVAWSIHRLDKRTLPLSHAEGHLFTDLPRRTTQTDTLLCITLTSYRTIHIFICRYIHKFVLIYRSTPVCLCDTIKENSVGYWCPLHTWNKTLGYYISYASMGLPHYQGMLKIINAQ